jgi:hypothetical protein
MKRVVPENIARCMSEEDRKTHGIETAGIFAGHIAR